jgi:hypothetical protein
MLAWSNVQKKKEKEKRFHSLVCLLKGINSASLMEINISCAGLEVRNYTLSRDKWYRFVHLSGKINSQQIPPHPPHTPFTFNQRSLGHHPLLTSLWPLVVSVCMLFLKDKYIGRTKPPTPHVHTLEKRLKILLLGWLTS